MRLTVALLCLFSFLCAPASAPAEDRAIHNVIDDLEALAAQKYWMDEGDASWLEVEIFAANLIKRVAPNQPGALTARNERGQTPAMRASETGMAQVLLALLEFDAVREEIDATDSEGLTIGDHAILSAVHSIHLCYALADPVARLLLILGRKKPGDQSTESPSSAHLYVNKQYLRGQRNENPWSVHLYGSKAYQVILDKTLALGGPTNPHRAAEIWLQACSLAEPSVRAQIEELGRIGDPNGMQAFLIEEGNSIMRVSLMRARQRAEQRAQREYETAAALSDPKSVSARDLAKMLDSDTVTVGPLTLANHPDGGGVVIAAIAGDAKELSAASTRHRTLVAQVGQRVTAVEYIKIKTLDDVRRAIDEFSDKRFKSVDVTVFLAHLRGGPQAFILRGLELN